MKFLLIEMLACLVAASVLGLIIGWLLKAAFAREVLMEREAAWSDKQLQLEADNHQKAELLKDQENVSQQAVGQLSGDNEVLQNALREHQQAVTSARDDVEALNGRYGEMENRLQAIIRQKDTEILHLQREVIAHNNAMKSATAAATGEAAPDFDQTQILPDRPGYNDPLRDKDK